MLNLKIYETITKTTRGALQITNNQIIIFTEDEFKNIAREKCRAARKKQGLSASQVAKAVGLTRATISNFENGNQFLSAYRLLRVMNELGVSINGFYSAPSVKKYSIKDEYGFPIAFFKIKI